MCSQLGCNTTLQTLIALRPIPSGPSYRQIVYFVLCVTPIFPSRLGKAPVTMQRKRRNLRFSASATRIFSPHFGLSGGFRGRMEYLRTTGEVDFTGDA